MGMFGDLGATIGAGVGAAKSAKGFKRAANLYNKLRTDYAPDVYGKIDQWGAAGRRSEMGDMLHGYLTGERDIKTDPGYQFVYDQAMQATRRQSASAGFGGGIASSGNAAMALQDRASGLASQEYGKIIDRLTNLSSAGQAAGIAGGQMYGDLVRTSIEGEAGAKIGKYNALGQANAMGHAAGGQVGDIIASSFSDARLKNNIRRIGKDGDLYLYKWEWNEKAEEAFGLKGEDTGYIAQEVKKVMPEAVTAIQGYLAIDYGYISELREGAA